MIFTSPIGSQTQTSADAKITLLVLRQPDMFLAVQMALHEKFGLNTDALRRQFFAFLRLTKRIQDENPLPRWADLLRKDSDLIKNLNACQNQPQCNISFDVYEWFLTALREFGVDFTILPNGDVQVRGVNPKMSIAEMSSTDKIGEAMQRAIPMLPAEAQEQIKAMLTPESLAIVAGTLIVWAASHFFGIGEVVDIILLVAGVAFIGLGVFSGAEEFYAFAETAINAATENDLDRAAQHFAKAVNILGITVISALLLKKSANTVISRGRPQIRRMPNVGPPTPRGIKITRPFRLPSGALGETDFFGNIQVSRSQPIIEQRITLYHEWVHSVLSPRFGPLRQMRAQLRASAYTRSYLFMYIEEAMAESYAQLRVYGLQNILVGIRFPIQGGYITISQIASEGIAIGNITIGGLRFTVYFRQGVFNEDSK